MILGPTPIFPNDNDFFSTNRRLFQGNEVQRKQIDRSKMNQIPFEENSFWIKTLIDNENIFMITRMNIFCDSNICNRWLDGWLFADYNHLSSLGAKYLKPRIVEAMDNANM